MSTNVIFILSHSFENLFRQCLRSIYPANDVTCAPFVTALSQGSRETKIRYCTSALWELRHGVIALPDRRLCDKCKSILRIAIFDMESKHKILTLDSTWLFDFCQNLRTLLTTPILYIDFAEAWYQIAFIQCLQHSIDINECKIKNLDINRQKTDGT